MQIIGPSLALSLSGARIGSKRNFASVALVPSRISPSFLLSAINNGPPKPIQIVRQNSPQIHPRQWRQVTATHQGRSITTIHHQRRSDSPTANGRSASTITGLGSAISTISRRAISSLSRRPASGDICPVSSLRNSSPLNDSTTSRGFASSSGAEKEGAEKENDAKTGRLVSQENYYKQFWRNVKANLNLPIIETMEHWIWRTRVGRGIKDFNVNANNEMKAALTKPLGPPIEVFDQRIQLTVRHAVVGGPVLVMLLFGRFLGFFSRLILLAVIIAGCVM